MKICLRKTLTAFVVLIIILVSCSLFACDEGEENTDTNKDTGEHVHSFSERVVPPTCTEMGYTEYICECDETYRDNYTEKIAHSFTEESVPAGCTDRGYTKYTCQCGETYSDNYVDALGHSWVEYERIEADCDDPTRAKYSCHCGAERETVIGDPIGHTYVTTVTEPTCEDMGYTTNRCHCGYEYTNNYVPAKGHEYTTVTVVPPTKNVRGYTLHECHCGDSYKDSYVDALEHDYGSGKVIRATCEEHGYVIYTCVDCGDSYEEFFEKALGHEYSTTVVAPTCTEEGYTLHFCTRDGCEHQYKDEYVDEKGHDYNEIITKPTCTEWGYTTFVCSCGHSYDGDFVKEKGHSYVVKKVYKPSCNVAGYTEYICDECDDEYSDDHIKELGHDLSFDYNDEKHWKKCSRCSYTEREEEHYIFECECGYVHPAGTLFYGDAPDGEGYFLLGYQHAPKGETMDLVIPSTYKGKAVTFNTDLLYESEDIRSLTLSDGVILNCTTGWTVRYAYALEEIYINTEVSGGTISFSECPKLKKVVYPDGLTTLGELSKCNSVEELTVPASVRSVWWSYYNLDEHSLTVNYEGDLEDWLNMDDSRMSFLEATDKLYINGEELTDVIIPEGVSSVPDYAFHTLRSIKSVTVPATVESVGRGAFLGCASLERVSVGAALIGPEAFMDCTSLKTLDLCEGIGEMGYSSFANCDQLTSVVLPDGMHTIGSESFVGCTNLLYAYVPSSLETVNTVMSNGSHFSNSNPIFDPKSNVIIVCEGDENTAGSKMTYANVYLSFDGYDTVSIVETKFLIYFSRSLSDIFTVDGYVFVADSENKTAELVRYIGDETELIIPAEVEYGGRSFRVSALRENLFYRTDVRSFCIPRYVSLMTSMLGTDTVESVSVDAENLKYTVVDGVLFTADMKKLICYPSKMSGNTYTVPDSVENIMNHSFVGTQLKYVYAPHSSAIDVMSFIGKNNLPVVGTDSASIDYNAGTVFVKTDKAECENVIFKDDFVYLVRENEAALISYTGNEAKLNVSSSFTHNGENYNVISVYYGAFENNGSLEEIIFEEGFVMFGNYEYGGLKYPEGFAFDESFYTVSMQYGTVFNNCPSLRSITLPKSTKDVILLASNCHALTFVDLGGVENICYGILDCNGIESITLPPTLKKAYINTVSGCKSLKALILGTTGMTTPNADASMEISAYSVNECELERLVIGDEVKTFEIQTVNITDALDYVYVGAGGTEIFFVASETSELHYYGGLDELLRSGTDGYFRHVYVGGEMLSGEFVLKDGYTEKLGCLLQYNEDITKVVVEESDVSIGSNVFGDAKNISEVVVNGDKVEFFYSAFPYAKKLVINGSVSKISDSFVGLEEIYLENIDQWLDIEFVEAEYVLSSDTRFYIAGSDEPTYDITIPEGVTEIGAYTFFDLDPQKYTFTVHKDVTYIGRFAFGTHENNSPQIVFEDAEGWYCTEEDDIDTAEPYNEEMPLGEAIAVYHWNYWFKKS